MTIADPSFLAFVQEQPDDYRYLLPQRLVQARKLWQQALSDEKPAKARALLERRAYGLAEPGATFGFAGLGDAACPLELALRSLVPSACVATATAHTDVSQAIELLQRSLHDQREIQGIKS